MQYIVVCEMKEANFYYGPFSLEAAHKYLLEAEEQWQQYYGDRPCKRKVVGLTSPKLQLIKRAA